MVSTRSALALLACSVAAAYAQDADEEFEADFKGMGPAAFMWPADREWSASKDTHAPCGSAASPGNRTDFPMRGGRVSLVAQEESYDMELSVAYMDDPKSNSDFDTIFHSEDLEPGHTCFTVEDAPSSAKPGDLATLQIKYISKFDEPEKETFYACADIKLIETAKFDTTIMCMNVTESDMGDGAGGTWNYHGDDDDEDKDDEEKKQDDKKDKEDKDNSSSSSSDSTSSDSSSDEDNKSGGSSGLSDAAIAGAVVGSVAGLGLLIAAGIFLYRRKQQRLNKARQESSSRGVQWQESHGEKPPMSSAA